MAKVSNDLFNKDGSLNASLVPPGTKLRYQAYLPDSTPMTFRISKHASAARSLTLISVLFVAVFCAP